jgi:phage replication O-like protein O
MAKTFIENDIMENLISSGLNGTELSVVLFLIRKTNGWNKETDEISLSQFLKYIPVTKPTLCKAIKNLQLVKIVKLVKKGKSLKSSNEYRLEKNRENWQLVKKTKLVKFKKRTSKDFDTQLVKKPLHTKNTITKNTIQRTKEIDKEKFFFLKDKEFEQAFNDYLDMRKANNKKATDKAKELVLVKLHKHDIKTAIAMLEQSTMNSYQGVFPIKPNNNQQNKGASYGQIKRHSEGYPKGTVI